MQKFTKNHLALSLKRVINWSRLHCEKRNIKESCLDFKAFSERRVRILLHYKPIHIILTYIYKLGLAAKDEEVEKLMKGSKLTDMEALQVSYLHTCMVTAGFEFF